MALLIGHESGLYCPRCDDIVSGEVWEEVPVGYTWRECCRCGSDEVEQASECPACGELMNPENRLCEECSSLLNESIEETIKMLQRDDLRLSRALAIDIILERMEEYK